jgi:hypothetical protein
MCNVCLKTELRTCLNITCENAPPQNIRRYFDVRARLGYSPFVEISQLTRSYLGEDLTRECRGNLTFSLRSSKEVAISASSASSLCASVKLSRLSGVTGLGVCETSRSVDMVIGDGNT